MCIPSAKVVEYWKFRADLDVVSLVSVLEYVRKWSNVFCYVREKLDNNPHAHFYIESTTKEHTMRKHIREKLGLKGNGSYSLKQVEKDPIAYLAYMMKEGEPQFVNISSEVIDESISYNDVVKNSIKEKKEKKKSMIERVRNHLANTMPDYPVKYTLEKYEEIYTKIIDFHIDNGVMLREFQLKSIFNTIGCECAPRFKTQYINKLMLA